MNKKSYTEELNLFFLIRFLWINRLKIFLSIVIAIFITLVFELFKKKEIDSYLATTEIFPITNLEFSRYKDYNSFVNYYNSNQYVKTPKEDSKAVRKQNVSNDFSREERLDKFKITRLLLLNMYLEKIADKQFLKKAIIKYELVDKENYNTEESFNEAVLRLASSIKIIEKINQNTYKIEGVGSPIIKHLQMSIVANINNKKKWESALFFIHEHTNKFIKDHIRLSFQNDISKLKQQYKYRLEDIETELLNVKETYKRTTKDRLAFLNEQREIARHLEVATSTITAQTFLADSGVVASFELDMPYYLKGYEMIEKEIELVKNRSDEEAFMPDLLDLENIKRKIFQSEKKLKRIERVFAKTPVVDLDNFYAADLAIRTTSFIKQNTNNSLSKKLILAVLIGGILGVVFSLIWVNRKKFK